MRHVYGGERWFGQCGQLDIIKAGDRDIIGHGQAHLLCCAQGTDGKHVICAQNGCCAGGLCHQFTEGFGPFLDPILRFQQNEVGRGQAGFRDRVPHPLDAITGPVIGGGAPRDHSDVAMSQLHHLPTQCGHGGHIVKADRRLIRVVVICPRHKGRHVAPLEKGVQFCAAMIANEQQRIRAARHKGSDLFRLKIFAVARRGDEQRIAVPAQLLLKGLQAPRKYCVFDRWDDSADGIGALGGKGACIEIGRIAKLIHSGHHPVAGRLSDLVRRIQAARNSGRRHIRVAGHIGKGWYTGGRLDWVFGGAGCHVDGLYSCACLRSVQQCKNNVQTIDVCACMAKCKRLLSSSNRTVALCETGVLDGAFGILSLRYVRICGPKRSLRAPAVRSGPIQTFPMFTDRMHAAMTREYLKKATLTARSDASDVSEIVQGILSDIEAGGDAKALEYAAKFDKYEGNVLLTEAEIEAAIALVPEKVKRDIEFSHGNVKRFAEAQKASMQDIEVEVLPGMVAGQKMMPVEAAGCYVPGGRYSHIASAIMTVTTAKVAGCKHIVACSPPRPGVGVAPAIVYAAHICGADKIMAMGGVQAIAAMTFGLFDLPKANILVGPGNQFVAEAKRILFGRVGIDMIAGPTDSLILADAFADPMIVATDLVGQAEHGYNSPVWLVTDSRLLAEEVMRLVPTLIEALPDVNRENATAAWRDYAEVILCEDPEEMAATSDEYAPEHLTVMADDLDWWLERLSCYGSLFLGEETTVAFGDKASGTNHVLPTSRAATYTGGLSVHKYMKVVTWQRSNADGMKPIAEATARISRLEGMEAHARTADIRLAKFFPDENFDLKPEE